MKVLLNTPPLGRLGDVANFYLNLRGHLNDIYFLTGRRDGKSPFGRSFACSPTIGGSYGRYAERVRDQMKLFAIGFLPPPLGGVSVSFKIFCDLMVRQPDLHLQVRNLSGIRRHGWLFRRAGALAIEIWTQVAKCDVVTLYCATTQVPTVGLLTLACCRLHRKPFILRKAAGVDHLELGPVAGRLAEYVVRKADLFLVETKRLVETCKGRNIQHTEWFPTSRPAGPLCDSRHQCRRFVYVAQVRPSKGVVELIAATDGLPSNVIVDVYGPFFDGLKSTAFDGHSRIRYRSIVDPDDVVETLRQYDAFILPSKADTEGYPGAILEAFSVGLPVISTTVGGIPEIVDEQCGILVEPGNVDALENAMKQLISDDILYQRLCCGAREARERFSAEYWTGWMVRECIKLLDRHQGASDD